MRAREAKTVPEMHAYTRVIFFYRYCILSIFLLDLNHNGSRPGEERMKP